MKSLKTILKQQMLNVEELMMIKGAVAPVGSSDCGDNACINVACSNVACTQKSCSTNTCSNQEKATDAMRK